MPKNKKINYKIKGKNEIIGKGNKKNKLNTYNNINSSDLVILSKTFNILSIMNGFNFNYGT